MRSHNLVFAGLLGALALSAAPVSAEGFICPTTARHVEVGDSDQKVLSSCGAPKRREDIVVQDCGKIRCYEVKIGERWTYVFGPTYLVRYLAFHDGKLTQIEVGDYHE